MRSVLFVLSVVVLAAVWILTGHDYAALPAQIATHVGIDGKPTAYGPRELVWALPALATSLLGTMLVASRRPDDSFRFPVKLAPTVRARALEASRTLIAFLGLDSMLTFVSVERLLTQPEHAAASIRAIFALVALALVAAAAYYVVLARARTASSVATNEKTA
jgi:uncharacterized membrane protein